MKNARSNTGTTGTTADTGAAQQLTLLPDLAPAPNVHARFLLSKDTRELGLRHVAEIRQVLAERKAGRDAANVIAIPTRPGNGHRAA